jgi:phosphate transport system permease protein
VLLGSGLTVLVLLALIGVFLLLQSRHALAESGWSFFTRIEFNTEALHPLVGVLGLLIGTLVVSAIAVVIAIPLAIGVSLYITEYAPPGLRKLLQGVIDLLASVPSLLYGLWGFLYLGNVLVPLERWLSSHLSFVPFLSVAADSSFVNTYFIAGVVVALMVIPITASVTREVFAQTPQAEKEAALALGATRWVMIKEVVLPFGRGGIIGGSMLGLGRALGETIAVSLLLPQIPAAAVHIFSNGGSTIAGFIAERAGSDPFTTSALLATGLVLFVITLLVNIAASTIIGRSRSGAGLELAGSGSRVTMRLVSELTPEDWLVAFGCALSSIAGCWLVFARLTEGIGWFGFLLVAYVVFVGLFYVVTAERLGSIIAVDRTVSVVVSTSAFAVLVPLLWLVLYIFDKGLPGLSAGFFTHDMRGITPLDPATAGGGEHAIVGTLEEVGIALVLSVPLAILTAVFLNETRSRWRRPVRIFVDAMSGKPSIVAGLFIYALLILPFAGKSSFFGFNGLMAALALSLTMMPTVARTVEVVLRIVPGGLRQASLAMGASWARTVWSVVLPTARSGIATAVVLGIARTVGETAPLLFTSFGQTLMNANPFSGPQESLPLYIYSYIREPNANTIQRGFTGALVLMVLVLLLFVIARLVGRDRSMARRRPFARITDLYRRGPGWSEPRLALAAATEVDFPVVSYDTGTVRVLDRHRDHRIGSNNQEPA